MFASKSNRGFYDAEIHGAGLIPEDAIEISAEYHAELLAGESGGKIITWRDDGFPVLADPPPPSDEALAAVERAWRDQRLFETDGSVSRHRDELEEGQITTLTPTQYTELQAYRRALRNWPEAGEIPLIEHRPPTPLWMADQLQ